MALIRSAFRSAMRKTPAIRETPKDTVPTVDPVHLPRARALDLHARVTATVSNAPDTDAWAQGDVLTASGAPVPDAVCGAGLTR